MWASSAGIDAPVEYQQFMSNAFYTINSIGGPECGDVLNGAFRMIEEAIVLRNTTYVEQRLNLCSPIDIDIQEQVARLFFGIASDVGSFISNARYPDIDNKCMTMRGDAVNDLDAFARWYVDDFNQNLECISNNNTAILSLYQNTEWESVSTIGGIRQNFWLQCTQLGQFAVANGGENHPFGSRFDSEFFRHLCSQAFDQDV